MSLGISGAEKVRRKLLPPGVPVPCSLKPVGFSMQGKGKVRAANLLVNIGQYNVNLVIPIGKERRQVHVGYIEVRRRQIISAL